MEQTKTLIGIDPGQQSGWGLLTIEAHPRLIARGRINFVQASGATTGGIIGLAVERARRDAMLELPRLVVIEGQFVGKNIASALTLARNAGRWEEGAASNGIKSEYIQPSTWIAAELGHNLRHEQIGPGSKAKVAQLYKGLGDLSEHECAAILIGRFAAIEAWRAGMQQVLPVAARKSAFVSRQNQSNRTALSIGRRASP